MYEKVIHNTWELNAAARHLRETGGIKELKMLAAKWLVPPEDVEAFIEGRRYALADARIEEKEFANAGDKLREEMWRLKDKAFADIIARHLIAKCGQSEEFSGQVLQKHKTLQKCLDAVMEQAYECMKKQMEDAGKDPGAIRGGQQSVAMAVREADVYAWAEGYYGRDDAAEDAEKAEKAQKERLEAVKKEEEREKKNAELATKRSVPAKEKKKEEDQQMNLFNLLKEEKPDESI